MTLQIRHAFIITLLLLIIYPTLAQEDQPFIADIDYGMTITESITETAFFDWWRINVQVGDEILVSMEADDGLQPLIGLLDYNGDLMARSDVDTVAPVDGTAFLQYEVLTEGEYTIIASRDGRDLGTTTGRYLLTVNNRTEFDNIRTNPFMETEFRCSETLLTNALTFEFSEDYFPSEDIVAGQPIEYYRVSVYGLDGFQPYIRLLSDIVQDRSLDCTDSSNGTIGTQLDLPFLDATYEVTEDSADNVAMVTLTNSGEAGPLGAVTVSIGAEESISGKFIVILEGMQVDDRMDDDEIRIRRGPFANAPLDMYVLGYPNTRLDPVLETQDLETDTYQLCDDIGKDDCSEFVSLETLTMIIGDNKAEFAGDRFDAGLRIDSEDNNRISATIRSRAGSTTGEYVLIFVGELPARD